MKESGSGGRGAIFLGLVLLGGWGMGNGVPPLLMNLLGSLRDKGLNHWWRCRMDNGMAKVPGSVSFPFPRGPGGCGVITSNPAQDGSQ